MDTYYIIRGDRSGVYFGKIARHEGQEIELTEVRKIWYWSGAATLLQLSAEGVTNPLQCKFSMTIPSLTITDCIEFIPCSEAAVACIQGVKEWKL